MPTVITRYLVTTAGAGGDGSIGSPYNTLEAARTDIIADYPSFVASDVQVDLICSGATDDSTAVTNTWPTSDTTRYLHIKVPDSDRKAQWDANVYTYARDVSGDTSAALAIGTNSVRLSGVQIYQTGTSGSNFCRAFEPTSLGGELVMDGVKLRGSGGSNDVCMRATNIGGTIVMRNCATINTLHGLLLGNPTGLVSGTQVILYNLTVIGRSSAGGEAVQLTWAAGGSGRIARVKNLIMRNVANGISTTNEDTEDLATNNHSSASPSTTDFVDPANQDYRLKSGGSLMDAGTNLSGVADWPFSIDAALGVRPSGVAWDQGFHEFGSSPPGVGRSWSPGIFG
jgi:hypothetical protein